MPNVIKECCLCLSVKFRSLAVSACFGRVRRWQVGHIARFWRDNKLSVCVLSRTDRTQNCGPSASDVVSFTVNTRSLVDHINIIANRSATVCMGQFDCRFCRRTSGMHSKAHTRPCDTSLLGKLLWVLLILSYYRNARSLLNCQLFMSFLAVGYACVRAYSRYVIRNSS